MSIILKIIKYQLMDNLRSKWLFIFLLFLMLFSFWFISFSPESSKVILSLLNITLIVVPLISILFGTVYIYNNKNYITFMLSQPIGRKSLYCGLFFGLVAPLVITFFLGIGFPVLFNLSLFSNALIELLMIFISGFLMILIFTGLAFLFTTITDDKLKGFGAAIFSLLFLLIIYDGFILFLLEYFQDYPTENLALILILFNPIDIGRILIVLKFDISALMGYTGVVFENFFGTSFGMIISLIIMCLWFIIPFLLGLRIFSKKDI